MTKPIITVEGLSKSYVLGQIQGPRIMLSALKEALLRGLRGQRLERPTLWALKDVSFSVSPGEVVGIIGRNGAGKSTLLKVLSRITYPTKGRVTVNGRVASLLEVGTGFHDDLTGRENIYLNGSILGMRRKEIDAKLDAIVEFSGVEKFLDTPIKRYSSGMRLRLGFAVAAHLDPDLLIVDEVLAVGDAEFQKKCLNKMEDLRGGGRTVLFVSHNLSAVENLCSRSIWVDHGQIRMDADTPSVIKSYLSSSVSTTASGAMDLTNIPTRTGNGLARFTAVEFLDKNRQPLNYLYSGCEVVIRTHFDVYERVQDLMVGIEINSDMGLRVAASNSWVTDLSIPNAYPGKGYLDWEIDFLNLQPGRYNLSLWLGPWGNQHDILQHVVNMDVETSDYYKTGRGIDPKWGLVFLPGRWSSDKLPTTPPAEVAGQARPAELQTG
jgi:lipopolysaccharide transport system ATP-binding protein